MDAEFQNQIKQYYRKAVPTEAEATPSPHPQPEPSEVAVPQQDAVQDQDAFKQQMQKYKDLIRHSRDQGAPQTQWGEALKSLWDDFTGEGKNSIVPRTEYESIPAVGALAQGARLVDTATRATEGWGRSLWEPDPLLGTTETYKQYLSGEKKLGEGETLPTQMWKGMLLDPTNWALEGAKLPAKAVGIAGRTAKLGGEGVLKGIEVATGRNLAKEMEGKIIEGALKSARNAELTKPGIHINEQSVKNMLNMSKNELKRPDLAAGAVNDARDLTRLEIQQRVLHQVDLEQRLAQLENSVGGPVEARSVEEATAKAASTQAEIADIKKQLSSLAPLNPEDLRRLQTPDPHIPMQFAPGIGWIEIPKPIPSKTVPAVQRAVSEFSASAANLPLSTAAKDAKIIQKVNDLSMGKPTTMGELDQILEVLNHTFEGSLTPKAKAKITQLKSAIGDVMATMDPQYAALRAKFAQYASAAPDLVGKNTKEVAKALAQNQEKSIGALTRGLTGVAVSQFYGSMAWANMAGLNTTFTVIPMMVADPGMYRKVILAAREVGAESVLDVVLRTGNPDAALNYITPSMRDKLFALNTALKPIIHKYQKDVYEQDLGVTLDDNMTVVDPEDRAKINRDVIYNDKTLQPLERYKAMDTMTKTGKFPEDL